MKLQFEPDLDFQLSAIESVCDLFRGQEVYRSEFSLSPEPNGQARLGMEDNDLGIGNLLNLPEDVLLDNLQDVQLRNGLQASSVLGSKDFTVEMETGTGKTYVYLRTIFELNKRYGFTKFAIVVPSIAIKEGVNKSLEIMGDHLRNLYSGTPFDHFIYDSAKLGQVRNFATGSQIQIMVMTVGAINKKDVNTIYQENEKTGGEKPIDLVKATRPILIVDEPQSVDGGLAGRGKEALQAMNPLCTLRFSATHVETYNMIYRLNAVDAYQQGLVKQIEVAAGTIVDDHNSPYVRLIETKRRRGSISARVEIDIEGTNGHVSRRERNVQDGDDLEILTGRSIYQNHYVGEIRAGQGKDNMELRTPGTERWLVPGEAYGSADSAVVQRGMIRKTIQEHLDKERLLHPAGIKVLSLIFIDQVSRYRAYDENDNPSKGEYALLFEEEFRRAANHPDYRSLFEETDLEKEIELIHNGYFSIDKKTLWTNTEENNQANRENAERAYRLIMRDKEKLLSLEEPLRFIFSHSALKEGWDNPNVFQICSLRDIGSERERRQTLGRGLRLCVNQAGERQRGADINTLTVVARESYQEFAENLQREIENDTGIRFGVLERHQFASIQIMDENGQPKSIGIEKSEEIWKFLESHGYVNDRGEIEEPLREALRIQSLILPVEFEALREAITKVIDKADRRIHIKNASERRALKPREVVLDGEDFQFLWNTIKHKTTYRVHFDNDELITRCTEALSDIPLTPRTRIQWNTASIQIDLSGVEATSTEGTLPTAIDNDVEELPDVLTELQNRTQLTRRSIQKILSNSGRIHEIRYNPHKFIEMASHAINFRKRLAIVDGVKYQRLGEEFYYAQELFKEKELTSYLKNSLEAKKSVYERIPFDSSTEEEFARHLEANTAIKVYAKLPRWFSVATPLGPYNPDWAVLVSDSEGERVYFVAETKGSQQPEDLRETEKAKTICGKAHFEELSSKGTKVNYRVVTELNQLLAEVS